MKFTTRFVLQSQETRLLKVLLMNQHIPLRGILTLGDAHVRETLGACQSSSHHPGYNSKFDSTHELITFHSPLLKKSLLVSFPPPINMLKFSG